MLHRFSTAFIAGEFVGQHIVSMKFGRLLLFFFAPCLDGFGCVCWRPVLNEALKVWPYLLCRRSLALLRPPNNNFFRIGQLKQIFTISVRKKKSSYSFAGRFLYCLTDFKPVAPYVAVSRSFFCLQPSLFMNLQTVFFPQTGSLNFFRLLRVFITPSVRLNRSAVNAVQWRHYSLTFALIHAKSKTRFSSGKPRNTVWKCLHDTELLLLFRS